MKIVPKIWHLSLFFNTSEGNLFFKPCIVVGTKLDAVPLCRKPETILSTIENKWGRNCISEIVYSYMQPLKEYVTTKQGLKLAKFLGNYPYFEVSARNGTNINALFETAIRMSVRHTRVHVPKRTCKIQ